MTISSALNAGVQGLNVNATRLSTISDNIANSSTNGYKRSVTDFSSLVVNQQANNYSAGGVVATTFKDVASTASLISTGNALDIAINGNGLIPVTDESGVTQSSAERDFLLLPTGSFSADENGNLRTQSGLFLLGWPTDAQGEVITGSRDSSAGLEPVNVDISQFSASPTRNIELGVNLPAEATALGASGEDFEIPVEYFDNLGSSQVLTYTFSPNVPAGPADPSNVWNVSVTDGAGDPLTPVANFEISFNDTPGNGGSINTITPGAGTTYDPATGDISFNVESGPISSFLGRPGSSDGITQLAAPFTPINVSVDGAPIGEIQEVEISIEGNVEAIFNTGQRRTLFQVPVADVPNVNGLTAQNSQAFSISADSGDLFFWDAGTGPTGNYIGYALTESATDIAQELTSLIETQRAYSSNATIIQTVDEMLQETANLGR